MRVDMGEVSVHRGGGGAATGGTNRSTVKGKTRKYKEEKKMKEKTERNRD